MDNRVKNFANVCLGAIGFLVGCLFIREAFYVPSRDLGHIYRNWEQVADSTDAIFIGSSNTNTHIISQLFDNVVRQKIPYFRSFNMGFYCAGGFDAFEFMRQSLRKKHSDRLKYVFVEAISVDASFRRTVCRGADAPETADLTTFPDILLRMRTGNLSWQRAWALAVPFVRSFTGHSYLNRFLSIRPSKKEQPIDLGWIGKQSIHVIDSAIPLLSADYYSATFSADSTEILAYAEIVRLIKSMGLIPIVVHGIPGSSPAVYNGIRVSDIKVETINPFATKENQNMLQKRRFFSDQLHLNLDGAKLYTTGLAKQFAEKYSTRMAEGVLE